MALILIVIKQIGLLEIFEKEERSEKSRIIHRERQNVDHSILF
jgi:hypothetical protein